MPGKEAGSETVGEQGAGAQGCTVGSAASIGPLEYLSAKGLAAIRKTRQILIAGKTRIVETDCGHHIPFPI